MTNLALDNILQINNLHVSYLHHQKEAVILNDISLEIKKGETIAIIGETGSGKSTLAKALIGLVPNVHTLCCSNYKLNGKNNIIQLDFENLKSFNLIRGKEVGIVFQEARAHLNPTMRCGKQLLESLQLLNSETALGLVLSALEAIGFENPERITDAYPHQLSGGECQRILMVMATLQNPSILILDEPTSSLDKPNEELVLAYLKKLQLEHQMTIIFITHDISIAQNIGDRILVIEHGNIIDDFNPKEQNNLSTYTDGLINSWQTFQNSENSNVHDPSEEVLSVNNVKVEYNASSSRSFFFEKKKTVVDSISFNLLESEVLGIFGNSGSGKTSLANAICGLIKYSSGNIASKYQQNIHMVFQNADLSLDPLQKVGDAIKEVLSKYEKSDIINKTKELFELVKLPIELFDKRPKELSGGQKQRICIARAIASNAKIIIFDEATASLDAPVKLEILQLLMSLKDKLDLTYIFITHELAVINFVTNRLLIMHNGSIIEQGETTSIVENPTNPIAKALILQSDV